MTASDVLKQAVGQMMELQTWQARAYQAEKQRDELLSALNRAHLEIIQLLNEGDFKRDIALDLGYLVDAIAKAEGRSK